MTAAENQATFDALAVELLEEFGVLGTFTIHEGGSYSPGDSKVTGGAGATYADVRHTPPVPLEDRYAPESVRGVASSVVYVAELDLPAGFEAPRGSVLELADGTKLRVVEVQELRAGDAPSARALFLRA